MLVGEAESVTVVDDDELAVTTIDTLLDVLAA
jgi:hypothetical protein